MIELDEKDLAFLHAVNVFGTATTSDIRRETGFTRGTMRYRYDKLEKAGLIETDYASKSSGSGSAPRTATLTKDGTQVLRRRKSPEDDGNQRETTRERLEDVKERLDRLDNRIYIVSRMQDDHEEQLEYMYQWMELAELYMKATRRLFEEEGVDFQDIMNEIQAEE